VSDVAAAGATATLAVVGAGLGAAATADTRGVGVGLGAATVADAGAGVGLGNLGVADVIDVAAVATGTRVVDVIGGAAAALLWIGKQEGGGLAYVGEPLSSSPSLIAFFPMRGERGATFALRGWAG